MIHLTSDMKYIKIKYTNILFFLGTVENWIFNLVLF